MLKMKVERSSRGGKKLKGTRRGGSDLVVTVANEESGESRLKPPVVSSQRRKIVLSQNKTESADLEKVTVKSLDEIKREKEQRQKDSAAASITSSQSLNYKLNSAAQVLNGSTSEDVACSGKLLESNGTASLVIATQGKPTSSTDVNRVKNNLPLKKLTIPLKALPAASSTSRKIFHIKPLQTTSVSRPSEPDEVSMDLDSQLPEQDFDYVDGDEDEESDIVDDVDEDFLLRDDHETEGSSNCQDSNDLSLSYDRLSGFTDNTLSDEPEDDEISLHPDDSLFDEEDELITGSSERVRPRSVGRRSGSDSRDLRAKLSEKQKQESSVSPVKNTGDESCPGRKETEDQKSETFMNKQITDNVPQRSDYRQGSTRTFSSRAPSRDKDERCGRRNVKHTGGRRNGETQFRNDMSRRGGQVLRQGQRKGSGPNVAPNLIGLMPSIGTNNGILPLPQPGPPSLGVDIITQLQAARMLNMANIQNNLMATVEMLTNPPPVPGEIVTNFEDSSRKPPVPGKREQSSLRGGKNARPVLDFSTNKGPAPAFKPPHQRPQRSENAPKWFQKTFEGANQSIEHGKGGQFFQGNSVEVVSAAERTQADESAALSPKKQLQRAGSYNDTNSREIRRSPLSDGASNMQASATKRKSPFHTEEKIPGCKIVVGTSPEGLPQPIGARVEKTYPKPLCHEQLRRGSCVNKRCQYWHLSKPELEEYQRSQESEEGSQEQLEDDQTEEQPGITQQQKKADAPEVSYDLVNALLVDKKLGAAWQMIEKFCRLNHPPDLSILQHVLCLCSKHMEQPDIAAQVACKAFDMIGGMVVHHNRHNYETLIKALCHCGQYIRAYEMLDVMKKDNHAPTYEVFLDLVQASAKDPDWAFNLLDEIKQSGVFKSKICSDLILLGCSSGEEFVERTFLLFQEALAKKVKLTDEAVSATFFSLLQTDSWDKIMHILPSVSERIPIEILKPAMLNASQRVDWTELLIAALATSPAEKLTVLEVNDWNMFLSNCSQVYGDNILLAQKVYSLMQQNGIPVSPESINDYMIPLSQSNWRAALELFTAIAEDPQVLEQPQTLEGGLIALSTTLDSVGAAAGMLNVVHFMLDRHIKPADGVLQSAVEHLDKEKNYKGVYQFFKQLEEAAIVAPFSVYRAIITSLEKWSENPSASFEPYVRMRQAYPAGQQSEDAIQRGVVRDSAKPEKCVKAVCRYFRTPRGCFSGEKCQFLHPEGGAAIGVSSQQSRNSFHAADVNVAQGSSHVSGGSSTSSLTDKGPSNPFVVQAHGAQPMYSRVPTATNQVPPLFESHQMSHLGMEPSPFVLQNTSVNSMPFTEVANPGNSHEQTQMRPDNGTSSDCSAGSTKSQQQNHGRQLCRYFSTPRGCLNGDNCRFIHHSSAKPMPLAVNPTPAMSEIPSGGSNGAVVRDNCSGTPFVLRGPPSSGRHAHDQHHAAFQARPVANRPAMGSHHFQLAGASHFKGVNPFTPTLPARAHSLDSMGEPKPPGQSRQAHSAPIVQDIPGSSCFQYPSKRNVQFYLPRIKHASQHQSWKDLGYVYIIMKNEDVEIDSGMLEAFYQAFATFCPDTLGESFKTFVNKVCHPLEEGVPESDPDRSPSSPLDDADKYFIGQLGVALMYFCCHNKRFSEGYNVLHVLHQFSIIYSLYNGEFGFQQRPLTTTEVSLTAADICLHLEEPAYASALEVLRGTSYALPAEDNGALLTPEEADWRRRVFHTLCQSFMREKEFDFVYELLSEVGNIDVFGRRELKSLYNEFLVTLIGNNELEVATQVLKSMDTNLISRDPETVRAFVKGFGGKKLIGQAKQHFFSGCISGVYPISFNQVDPWTVVIGTSYSALESQLYIEHHLQQLYEHIEEIALKCGHRVLDDNYHKPLTVVVKSDEHTQTSGRYMRDDGIIRCVREMLCTVLTDDFNPPLSIEPQSKDEEIVVDALSLKRWFCANAASGRSKRGAISLATSSTSVAKLHPYLQPGMTNLVTSNSQDGGRTVCVVSEPGAAPVQGVNQQRAMFINQRGNRGRARPMSSTRAMSGRRNTKVPKTT